MAVGQRRTPIYSTYRGGDLMRERREASLGTDGARTLRRRLTRRMSLLVTGVGMFVFLAVAQAATAATVTSVTPAEGCPGEIITFHGTGFNTSPGSRNNVKW